MGVGLDSGSSVPLEFYCPCDGSLCTNYRLLEDGSFHTRCRRCKRFDEEFVKELDVFFREGEFTVIPK